MKRIEINGQMRDVLAMRQEGSYFRLVLAGGGTYLNSYPIERGGVVVGRLNEIPTRIQEAPDGNGNLVTYADGKTYRVGGIETPWDKEDIRHLEAIGQTTAKPAACENKPLTLSEALLFKVAMQCPALDGRSRKRPGHWEVFIAAWRERLSCYDMAREKRWPRRTVNNRKQAIERELLGGNKIEDLAFDSALLKNVERQLEAGRKRGAKLRRRELLDNTTGPAREYDD